jgi:hypothetical protein
MTVLCASDELDGLTNCVSKNFMFSLIIALYQLFIYATALLDHFSVNELISSYSETYYSYIISFKVTGLKIWSLGCDFMWFL